MSQDMWGIQPNRPNSEMPGFQPPEGSGQIRDPFAGGVQAPDPYAAGQISGGMPSSGPEPTGSRPAPPPYNNQTPPQAGYPNPVRYPAPPPAAKKRSMLPVLTAVAVLASGIGGGVALGLNAYLRPDAASVASSPPPAVTKVVQGNTSAPDWTVTADRAGKSTVSIFVASNAGQALGSGVILDNAGYILTNSHVVSAGSRSRIAIQIGDRQYLATVTGTDPSSDVAVVKIVNPPKDLVPITFADSDSVKVGDPVMAIGNPLGLSGTVTTGIVSAVNRPVTTSEGDQTTITNAIQTSAAINPGNSGGALVNANGELIGINSSIATLGSSRTNQTGNIGIGFAIESNLVKRIAKQIIETGSAQHAWLGVVAKDDSAEASGGIIIGARVAEVTAGSPAEAAGVKVGDLVTEVAGKQVSSLESLVAIVRAQPIGEKVKVQVIRGGKDVTVTATLVAAPKS